MITSVFKKSTILNYSLIVILVLFFFFLHKSSDLHPKNLSDGFLNTIEALVLLLASLFLVNFIVKKNGLTKDSSFAILFFLLFLALFQSIFNNTNILFANFFLLLAIRRLISLQTLKQPKEKIFDASIWIFIAALFHFWCILFIVLVYISIIFHVSRDYRNWLLPFVAFVTTAVVFFAAALFFDKTWIDHIFNQTRMNFELDYFTNNYQNVALSFYSVIALYFVFSTIFTVSNRPLILQASYKKMILAFIVGVIVFLISPDKNNSMLIFTLMPLSLMCTNNIEFSQNKMYKEIVLLILILGSFFIFFAQL
ncbi:MULTISPECIES: DUF6427 family protein [unclassified Flavobacterium]|uniref:DUF6427 family protein n=1 Tax=unclassified Flavobacterium TaxID=196869 RepID=UPI000EB0F1E4|nr:MULTISPECIES: DUF6427 family protein [unclassified Flavobacterium]RKS01105.1 hypothetical protein C8C84_0747 [Flavobacterium sp. 102]